MLRTYSRLANLIRYRKAGYRVTKTVFHIELHRVAADDFYTVAYSLIYYDNTYRLTSSVRMFQLTLDEYLYLCRLMRKERRIYTSREGHDLGELFERVRK